LLLFAAFLVRGFAAAADAASGDDTAPVSLHDETPRCWRRRQADQVADSGYAPRMAVPRSAQEVREPDGVEAVARTSAYRELVARRRRFTAVAGGLFYAVLGAFTALAAWAHDFMATRISGGLTVGYLAALVVVASVWLVVFAYARTSVRVLDPLAEDAQEHGAP
jgi:uncharacterized membrane protein (DUF485 family)